MAELDILVTELQQKNLELSEAAELGSELLNEVARLQSRVQELESALELPPLAKNRKIRPNVKLQGDAQLEEWNNSSSTLQGGSQTELPTDALQQKISILEEENRELEKRYKRLAGQYQEVSEMQWTVEVSQRDNEGKLGELLQLNAKLQADLAESERNAAEIGQLLEEYQTDNDDLQVQVKALMEDLAKANVGTQKYTKKIQALHARVRNDILHLMQFLNSTKLTSTELIPLIQGFLQNTTNVFDNLEVQGIQFEIDETEPGYVERVIEQWKEKEVVTVVAEPMVLESPVQIVETVQAPSVDYMQQVDDLRQRITQLDDERMRILAERSQQDAQLAQLRQDMEFANKLQKEKAQVEQALHVVSKGVMMEKYNRRGKNPQARFVWINPTSQTLHWSRYATSGQVEKSKSVKISSFVVQGDELIVKTPSRDVVFKTSVQALPSWTMALSNMSL